ncbi:YagK/YfjJ domain-containing protein [Acinetobacter kanungonis]|uniref:inovirus-type Gp2 protein n=1 Tax=Acinetobacter kanungonis TaxID=2699469 RepID=UPI001F337CD4|nr:inovirus-type Gp2 protein [Acinetobacter kanungonis]
MLYSDLSHQAAVMTAVEVFVEQVLHLDLRQHDFITHLCQLIPAFKAFDQSNLAYSASIQVFRRIVDRVDELRGSSTIEEYLTQLSVAEIKCLRHILVEGRTLILEGIRQFKQQETDNQVGLRAYLQSIILDRYKVLIVRVDLGYLKEFMPEILVLDFYRHIESLCKYLKDKNGCFKGLLWYGLALEQGATKGYHAHLLLIYNGSERQNDRFLADEVIQKWQVISEGMGYGVNINTKENKDKFAKNGLLGIGMIHRDNSKEVENALNAASYLVDPEKILQQMLIKPSGKRTFFKAIYKSHGRNYQTKFDQKQTMEEAGIWDRQDVIDLLNGSE